MTLRRTGFRKLYHTRMMMSEQHRILPCEGMRGEVTKIYPISSQARPHLVCALGTTDEGLTRWQYAVTVPVMLLSDECAGCGELTLYPELETPHTKPDELSGGTLDLDLELLPKRAEPMGEGLYDLCFAGRLALYLTL